MAETVETPAFYLEKAQRAEERAAATTDEAEQASWRTLANEYRRLAQTIREQRAFLAAITPKAAE